jgi:hypothetical protein
MVHLVIILFLILLNENIIKKNNNKYSMCHKANVLMDF